MLKKYLLFLFNFSEKALFMLIIINLQQSLFAQNNQINRSVRVYKVLHTIEKIKIDGRINEHAWQTAPFTEYFLENRTGSEPNLTTKAKMLWDDNNFYAAFIAKDNDIWSTMKEHDDPLWKQEAIEIFIDPDGDGRNYSELQINAIGTTFDLIMDRSYDKGGRGNPDWTLDGLKIGIKVDGTINSNGPDKSWICELAIPFRSLSAQLKYFPPKFGDIWRINLCRIERDRLNEKSLEVSAWNPTYSGSFHVTEKFGRIIFLDKSVQ